MKVSILEPSGFCAGVDRAINLAINAKNENPSSKVVVLGMLVHNTETLKTLEKHGISTIYEKDLGLEELADKIKEPSIVILTAHGHDKKIEEILLKNGHTIVDATCPFVKSSLEVIKKEIDKGNHIFYIGVKNHPEANASLSLDKNVHLIEISNPVIPEINTDAPLIISQTTLSQFEVDSLINKIKEKYKDARILDGICNSSTLRQKALMNLSDDIDGVLIVGGKNSNNSKTLYNLASKLYPAKTVLKVENISELNEKDLLGLSHVVISSGASTPMDVINEIKNKLSN